jgi:hypothetical protein
MAPACPCREYYRIGPRLHSRDILAIGTVLHRHPKIAPSPRLELFEIRPQPGPLERIDWH